MFATVLNNVKSGSQSSLAENLRYVCNLLQCDVPALVNMNRCKIRERLMSEYCQDEELNRVAGFVDCILFERDYLKIFFSYAECNSILMEVLVRH